MSCSTRAHRAGRRTFPIPMRGNEMVVYSTEFNEFQFPIPMRGNEAPGPLFHFGRQDGSRSP